MTPARCITNRFVVALLSLAPAMQDTRAADTATPVLAERVSQFIVKVKMPATAQSIQTGPADRDAHAALARRVIERVIAEGREPSPARRRRAAEAIADIRPMSGGAHVATLGSPISDAAATTIAERLQAQPEVEYAEPDYRLHLQLAPTDPLYAQQWGYRDATGAARFETAWETVTGSAEVVIAVADTGYRPHPDLAAHLLPGYDFVSNPLFSNDGDGRDADASDPGDWVTAEESRQCDGTDLWVGNSSWHGTHVAGTIGAVANNEIGGAGGLWHTRILPVRVLGKCGGPASDIIDAMRWAVGLPVPGVPDNPHPAKIVNVSLGTSQPCSHAMQAAIDDVIVRGASVVAAAGNSGAEVGEPASCRGAIAVAAIDEKGEKAPFSNAGARIDLGAPGVGIVSTANAGLTVPAEDNYKRYNGTSMAAPHVSAAIGLMLAVDPKLTPESIREKLVGAVRRYPDGSTCAKTETGTLCGAGMLDAAAAVEAARAASMADNGERASGG